MQQTVRVSARLPYARPGVGGLAPRLGDTMGGDLTLAGMMLREGGQVAPEPGRVALIVLGMHRSGTSAMARMLSLLGCALPATLMPARAGNEGGHWESEVICALNDAMLDSVGSHWADWRAVAPGADWLERGRDVLREEFGAAGLFVMKDPRQCRLMPFWRDVLAAEGVAARVVLTLRHPWEVAQSLMRRDGMGAARAQILWLGHMLGAEAGSRGMARSVCPYDALMTARARQGGEAALEDLAQDLGDRLGVVWPTLSPRVLGEMAAFLDPAARHHAADGDACGDVLTGWAGRVYAILSGWAAEGENARDYAELDAIAQALAQAGPDLARMLEENEALSGDVVRGRDELAEVQGALTDARGALAGALEWLGDERAEVTQTRVERDAARADLARARARLVDLDGALAERDAALAVRDGVLAMREAGLVDLAGLRDALVAERVALFARIEGLEQARDEADGWVLRLARERHGLQRDVARGARRIAMLEQAVACGAAREQGLGEVLARAKEQVCGQAAALAAVEGACAALREDLAQARKVDDSAMIEPMIEAVREQAGRDLAERYGEIAALTLMLREQVEAARQREGEAAWLRGLWSAMERAPLWWNWVPGGLRRWLRDGWLARRGVFDARAYRAEHRDVVAAGMDALDHYIRHGLGEGRIPVVEG